MIELIIPYINTRIETLNLFSRRAGICDIIKKGDISFPAEYCEGDYKQISDFDKEQGTIYHRLSGDISTAEADEELSVSCDVFIERTYPMRTVAVLKKLSLNGYSDSRTGDDIANIITFSNNKTLRTLLKADSISVEVNSISTDRDKVFGEEFKGIENRIPYEYSLVAIDYEIKVTGNVSCFENTCSTTATVNDLCPEITEIDGGSLALGDSQFVSINGLLDACSL